MKNLIALRTRMEDIDSLGVVSGADFATRELQLGANLPKIKKFNEKSRCLSGQISEINFRHMGSNKQAGCIMEKALKMQVNMDDCTIEAGRCIQ